MRLYGTSDRQSAWHRLGDDWDLIVVGGGITGAGILREAVRMGLRVLLLDQGDFSSGTSSRSSKLVHGGLRYLYNLQFKIVQQAAAERDELLREGQGLIMPLAMSYSINRADRLPTWAVDFGFRLYSWMIGTWKSYQRLRPADLRAFFPGLRLEGVNATFRYHEGQTDDSRLVLRLIREGVGTGRAIALNYARVEGLLRGADGQVNGVRVRDCGSGALGEARARAVINATGAWADRLRGEVGAPPRMRPLRGSHLIFPQYRFPLYQAVAFAHPDDHRLIFAFPWEGVTLLGTTDLDHAADLDEEASISPEEFDYLLRAVQAHFPELNLVASDVIATYAGVRPVISSGENKPPSKESRDYIILDEEGLLTVTGGKLTTFRHIAIDTLHALRHRLPRLESMDDHLAALDPLPAIAQTLPGLTPEQVQRLIARYGAEILNFAAQRPPEERACVDGLPIHWLELRWAARHEAVHHLDDLLLRRVRLGLLAPRGGEAQLPNVRALVQDELGWDDTRWDQEQAAYLARWRAHYSVPDAVLG